MEETNNVPQTENENINEAPSQEVIIEEAPSSVSEQPKAKSTPPQPSADFDWDTYEKGDIISKSQKKDLEEAYDRTLTAVKDHEVVEGVVSAMNKREVVVNIGAKQDGVISMSEFRYDPDLKVGDKVEVYVESQEDKQGQLAISHRLARQARSWDRVNEALEKQEVVKGYIKCRTKGGMIVDIFSIEAFLPGSQIDVKPIRDYDIFVGKTMEFKVVKINQEFKNVVVSHKALIEEEIELQKAEIMSHLQKGQVLEGVVKNITTYGVFIDLGGIDGLIHITDLSWGRITHPEEVVHLDEKLNVVILDFDEEKKRIALGLKQLSPHPWEALIPDLKVGDKISGKVVVMADYGAFVEVAPGVEGLVHVSEMSWSQHLRSAQDFLKVGDEVETVILTLDRDERKMSLGIKQLKTDPWDNIEEKYPVGSRHIAKVRNFTNFGVFVEIEEGVDGLIHISDLSWTKKVKHPSEFTRAGEDIEVVVLEIDKETRRLSLGHKQLEENPWDNIGTVLTEGSIHQGRIAETTDKGAIIILPFGVEGFSVPRQLIKEDGSQAQVNEVLDFKIIEFNRDTKRVFVSHSRTYEEAATDADKARKTNARTARQKEDLAPDEFTAQVMEKTTLGDIQQLADLKDQLDDAEAAAKVAKATKKVKKETDAKSEQVENQTEPAAEKEEPASEPAVEVAEKAAEEVKEEAKEEVKKTKKTATKDAEKAE
ncbi:MAG: 30S ribosomal protein S1 [Prevotellaceae bacterium]|nr:30S ribosomal protein S1 [Prevotellaceae bacterium]